MKKINEISGFENYSGYEVYEDGTVVSYKSGSKKVLKGYKNTKGYPLVDISTNKRAVKIHRLVALAFIPNPENKKQVNHIDGDKTNNAVWNLEWVTNSENQKHANKLGLRDTVGGDKHYNYDKEHHTCKKVAMMDEDNNVLATYVSLAQAQRAVNGSTYSNIGRCCVGKAKTAYGYKWKFI